MVKKGVAFLVGIDEYQDSSHLPPFAGERTPSQDVRDVLDVLESRHSLYVPRREFVLINQTSDGKRLTGAVLDAKLEDLLSPNSKHENVLIYFAGHGYQTLEGKTKKSKELKGYLGTYDAQIILDSTGRPTGEQNGLSFERLSELIEDAKHLKSLVLWIDACHSGFAIDSQLMRSALSSLSLDCSYSILAAAHRSEESYSGVFTRAVVERLRQKNLGPISADVISSYVIEVLDNQRPVDLSSRDNLIELMGYPVPEAPSTEPSHPSGQQDFVNLLSNLNKADWDELFQQFDADVDFADLKRAFGQGFEKAFERRFNQAASKYRSITDVSQIRDLLELHDADDQGPVLAVRFAECAIAQLQRTSEATKTNRDLIALAQWRDRIAARFGVPLDQPTPDQANAFRAYLLVALEVLAGSEVMVYPELHIAGQEKPMPFGADKTRCLIDHVTEPIAKWIQQVEATLEVSNYEFDEIVLEVFLPCRYLNEDIATTWKIKDERGDEMDFGNHRKFLVRSLDRVRSSTAQRLLKRRWADLKAWVEPQAVNGAFHLQDCCPSKKGDLLAALKDSKASGLKLIAPLPTDDLQRSDLLYDIIDAAVPIALWFSEAPEQEIKSLGAEFDAILDCPLTNFTALATQWRTRRRESPLSTSVRLLCDRPDRLPNLSDPDQDEDMLSFAS